MLRTSFPHSTAIGSAAYDPDTKSLTITFKTGAAYVYSDVPPEVWDGLVQADSPGSYWRSSIKDQYS